MGGAGRNWEMLGEGLLLDLGVSEAREINGSPPTHTHSKGWINPNDWERGGGVLKLGVRMGCLLPGLSWCRRRGREARKGQVSLKGQPSYLDVVNYPEVS